jgi:hypothetical protein
MVKFAKSGFLASRTLLGMTIGRFLDGVNMLTGVKTGHYVGFLNLFGVVFG